MLKQLVVLSFRTRIGFRRLFQSGENARRRVDRVLFGCVIRTSLVYKIEDSDYPDPRSSLGVGQVAPVAQDDDGLVSIFREEPKLEIGHFWR